jgi:hypothetical protein
VLDALFKSIFAEIKAQGDAALAYLPDAGVPQRQFLLQRPGKGGGNGEIGLSVIFALAGGGDVMR